MPEYSTFSDGSGSGSEAGAMARYVVVVFVVIIVIIIIITTIIIMSFFFFFSALAAGLASVSGFQAGAVGDGPYVFLAP